MANSNNREKQFRDAVAALDSLPKGISETVSEMARRGDLGLATALAESSSHAFDVDRLTSLSDSVGEVVQGVKWFTRPDSSVFEDIRLAERLLASVDATEFLDRFGTPPVAALLADFGRISDITRRVFETYPTTLEQLDLEIGSPDRQQLDSLVRQAATQLWAEVDRRGWTSPDEQPLEAQVDSADEFPKEFVEELDDTSVEEVAAFRRLVSSPDATYRVLVWRVLVWIVVTAVVPVGLHTAASRDQAIEHGDVMDAHGETSEVRAEQLKRQSEMLDILGEDRDTQRVMSNLLREILDAAANHSEEPASKQDVPAGTEQNDRTTLRPVPDSQASISELIEQAAETHREALKILAKR